MNKNIITNIIVTICLILLVSSCRSAQYEEVSNTTPVNTKNVLDTNIKDEKIEDPGPPSLRVESYEELLELRNITSNNEEDVYKYLRNKNFLLELCSSKDIENLFDLLGAIKIPYVAENDNVSLGAIIYYRQFDYVEILYGKNNKIEYRFICYLAESEKESLSKFFSNKESIDSFAIDKYEMKLYDADTSKSEYYISDGYFITENSTITISIARKNRSTKTLTTKEKNNISITSINEILSNLEQKKAIVP